MYYYGGYSGGYGTSGCGCGGTQSYAYPSYGYGGYGYGNYGYGNSADIVIVLFILLDIIIGTRVTA